MHTAILELERGHRVPIENIVGQSGSGMSRWVKAYRKFAKAGGQSLALHKQKLGKQDCTFTGEFRHWIWERPHWTVMVSRRGVEFDVPRDASVHAAWKLWRDYLVVMGLPVYSPKHEPPRGTLSEVGGR